MFEIGIISIIVLAVGYWVTLWLMGRHDDVLHGDFVHAEEGGEAAALPASPFPARPPFPPKPVIKRPATQPDTAKPVIKPAIKSVSAPAVAKPASAETPVASEAPASPGVDRSETLQALLASIKRDLKDASQL